jgi:hypothetical protein
MTTESVVTVYKATQRVVIDYNGAIRKAKRNHWKGLLKVARLVSRDALVLQLDVLDKPVTQSAVAFYEIFVRRNNNWVSVYRTTTTQLITSSAGRVNLSPVVIPIRDLRLGNVDWSTLELKTVAHVNHGGQQLILQDVVHRYQSITEITNIQQISTINTTSSGTTAGTLVQTSGGQTVTLANGFRLTFLGVTYGNSTSTWRYQVEELPRARNLSNWVLGLPACAQVVSVTPKGKLVNPDPNARIRGIKWEPGNKFRQGEFAVTLNQRLAVGTIEVAAKGPDVARGVLAGPSCNITSAGQ